MLGERKKKKRWGPGKTYDFSNRTAGRLQENHQEIGGQNKLTVGTPSKQEGPRCPYDRSTDNIEKDLRAGEGTEQAARSRWYPFEKKPSQSCRLTTSVAKKKPIKRPQRIRYGTKGPHNPLGGGKFAFCESRRQNRR